LFSRPKRSVLIVVLICLALFALFYLSFYPGGMVRDTAKVITAAINGEFKTNDPPIHVLLFSALLKFDDGVAPMLFLQLLSYWLAVAVFCILLLRRGWHYVALMLAIALYPYNIHLHNLALKDVLLLGCLLIYFALAYIVLLQQKPRLGICVVLFLVMIAAFMLRENAITMLPALAISTAVVTRNYWIDMLSNVAKSSQFRYAITLLAATSAIGAMAFIFNFSVDSYLRYSEKSDYNFFEKFLAPYDLMGMSIQEGHTGITKILSESEKIELERVYYGRQIFFKAQLGKVDRTFPPAGERVGIWIDAIRNNPRAYLKHRWQTFSKLFDGTGESSTSRLNRNAGWRSLEITSPKYAKRWWPIGWKPDAWMYQPWRNTIEAYFKVIPSHLFVPVLNLMMMVVLSIVFIKKSTLGQEGTLAMLMNLTAFFYYAPFFFVIHHPEVRYVYPSISIILFAIPFFLICIFGSTKSEPAQTPHNKLTST